VVEPMVDCRIIARVEDAGAVMELMRRKRGLDIAKKPIDDEKWLFTSRIPWAEVVTDLHDQLKNVTAGYGSLDTHLADPPWSDANHLCKVDLMLNGEVVAPLAFVCHRDVAHNEAKVVCKKVRVHVNCDFDFAYFESTL
jgi:translation elongation factor EF-4